MGRQDIIAGGLWAVFGLGGAAVTTALTVSDLTPVRHWWFLYGGAGAAAFSLLLLGLMLVAARRPPKDHPASSWRDIAQVGAAGINVQGEGHSVTIVHGAPQTGSPMIDAAIEAKYEMSRQAALERLPQASPFRLQVGETGELFRTKHKIYVVHRTLNLRIENADRQLTVRQCRVRLTDIHPTTEYVPPWVLLDDFTLAAGDHRVVPLVAYSEPAEPQISPTGDSFIEVLTTCGVPTLEIDKPSTLTIRVTGSDVAPADFQCVVWVGKDGRLHIREADEDEPERASGNVSARADVTVPQAIYFLVSGEWVAEPRISEETINTYEIRGDVYRGVPPILPAKWSEEQFLAEMLRLRQTAFDGEISVWGLERASRLVEPVPKEYWRHHEINPGVLMCENIAQTRRLTVSLPGGSTEKEWMRDYVDLKVNKSQIEALIASR